MQPSLALGRRRLDALMIAVALVGLWQFVRTITLVLPTWHVDGAFQAASALFRLNAGQFPGRDFFPYLGLAATYVPFPLFKAAGADLAASASAIYCVVFLASCATATLATRLLAPAIPSARLFIATLVAFPTLLIAHKFGYLPHFLDEATRRQLDPGLSMRSVRSFAPYLSAALLLLVLSRVASPTVRGLLFGAIGGGILPWSNDYGPPAAAMAALVMAIDLTVARQWTLANVAAGAVGAVVGGMATLSLLTGFDPAAFVTYNLSGVAHDQWWYFGPWGESERVFAFGDARLFLSAPNLVAFAILIAFSTYAVRRRDRDGAMFALIGLGLFTGGLVASVGGHVYPGYFAALHWWSLLVVAGLTARVVWAWMKTRGAGRLLTRRGGVALGAAVVLFAAGASAAKIVRQNALARNAALCHEPALGGFIEVGWRDYLTRAKRDGRPVIEEYWGLWSAVRRRHHGRVDMAIHALGPERVRFARSMAALPPLVVSSRPWATWGGQGWAMSVNWWFYAPLLRHYRIDAVSPKTYLWERAELPGWSPVACRVSPDAKRLFVDGQVGALFDVRVTYRVDPAPRRLLMAYNGLGMANGWIPLDDAAGHARFPVLFDPGIASAGIQFRTFPRAPGSPSIAVTGCTAAAIPMTDDVRAILPGVPGPAGARL